MNIHNNRKILVFGLISVPIMTFLLAIKESPFNYTFSMIGNWFDYRTEFIIWGIFTGILLTIFLIHLYKKTEFRNKKSFRFAYASGIFLILSVITPTTREPVEKALREPHFDLHLVWSLAFIVFFLVSLCLFSKYLSYINKNLSIKSLRFLLISVGGSIFLLTFFGMTGIFELFFFVSVSIYLIIIEKDLTKIKKRLKINKNTNGKDGRKKATTHRRKFSKT